MPNQLVHPKNVTCNVLAVCFLCLATLGKIAADSDPTAANPLQTGDSQLLLEVKKRLHHTISVRAARQSAGSVPRTFVKTGTSVRTSHNVIHISLRNGKQLTFKNKMVEDESESVVYEYHGLDNATQLVWLTKKLYEEEQHLLVHLPTGRIYEVANTPQLNSRSDFLFAKQNDCFQVAEDCSPGFQLWKITKEGLNVYEQVRLKGFYITKGSWKSATVLSLEIAPIQALMNGEAKTVKAQVLELMLE